MLYATPFIVFADDICDKLLTAADMKVTGCLYVLPSKYLSSLFSSKFTKRSDNTKRGFLKLMVAVCNQSIGTVMTTNVSSGDLKCC